MAKGKFYRVWAFYWDDEEQAINHDDGFEFFLEENSVDQIQNELHHFMSSASSFDGLIAFDPNNDDGILGAVRHPTDRDYVFGLLLGDDGEDLFFRVADTWFSCDEYKRHELMNSVNSGKASTH